MYLIISNKQKSTSLVILLSQVCALYLRLWEYLGQECLPIIENIGVGELVVLKKNRQPLQHTFIEVCYRLQDHKPRSKS